MGLESQTATIANNASLSGAITFLPGQSLVGVVMPATWTAASLTFQAAYDGATFSNMYSGDGTEYTLTVSTSRHVALNPTDFAGVQALKIRSGTSGTPVNQGGARSIVLVTRGVA